MGAQDKEHVLILDGGVLGVYVVYYRLVIVNSLLAVGQLDTPCHTRPYTLSTIERVLHIPIARSQPLN